MSEYASRFGYELHTKCRAFVCWTEYVGSSSGEWESGGIEYAASETLIRQMRVATLQGDRMAIAERNASKSLPLSLSYRNIYNPLYLHDQL